MRRQLAALTFAVIAGLSAGAAATPAMTDEAPGPAATVAVQRVSASAPAMRDEAAMVLVGSALIALAAALRRAA